MPRSDETESLHIQFDASAGVPQKNGFDKSPRGVVEEAKSQKKTDQGREADIRKQKITLAETEEAILEERLKEHERIARKKREAARATVVAIEKETFDLKIALDMGFRMFVIQGKYLPIVLASVFGTTLLGLAAWAFGVIAVVVVLTAIVTAILMYYVQRKNKTMLLKQSALEKKRKNWRYWLMIAGDALISVSAVAAFPGAVSMMMGAALTGATLGIVTGVTILIIVLYALSRFYDHYSNRKRIFVDPNSKAKWDFKRPMGIVLGLVSSVVGFGASQIFLYGQTLMTAFTVFNPLSLVLGILVAVGVLAFFSMPNTYRWRATTMAVLYGLFIAMAPIGIAMAAGLFTASLSAFIVWPLAVVLVLLGIGLGVYAGIQRFKYDDIRKDEVVDAKGQDYSGHDLLPSSCVTEDARNVAASTMRDDSTAHQRVNNGGSVLKSKKPTPRSSH